MTNDPHSRTVKATLVLLTFNQEAYVKNAVASALNQDYESLQIIISDDASSDATYHIIKKLTDNYTGQHQIVIRQNLVNQGLSRHVNTVLAEATGEVVLFAAGDDISLPDRTKNSVDLFKQHPDVTVVALNREVIGKDGEVIAQAVPMARDRRLGLREYLRSGVHLSGASRAMRRSVFETFGPLLGDCPTEDSPFLLRSLLLGDGIQAAVTGIKYRKHQNNLSSSSGLASMQFEKISRQYECDLKKAVGLHITDNSTLQLVETWIREREREHTFRSRATSVPSLRTILWMLRSPRFSRWEKLGLILKIAKKCACIK